MPVSDVPDDEPASPPGDGGLVAVVRLRLDLAYDGTDFAGWATQPGLRTVQQTVEDAVALVLRLDVPARLTVAGRTDAGVHARGQVAHVDVPVVAWTAVADPVRSLAGVLPRDVRVLSVAPAADGFDARFSALARVYAYRLCDDLAGPDPLRRHETLWVRRHRLDVARMAEASAALVGLHDFAAFCRHRADGTTIRTLQALSWRREPDGVVVGTVEADAFCHSMVRALVGALVAVGDGSRTVEWPAAVLAKGVRDPAVHVVGPQGLTLEAVRYPPEGELAARAHATRRPRA
jgi:tRNA pseudouridine38-40 synthase